MVSRLEADPVAGEDERALNRALRLPPGFNPRARTLAEGWRAASATDLHTARSRVQQRKREPAAGAEQPHR